MFRRVIGVSLVTISAAALIAVAVPDSASAADHSARVTAQVTPADTTSRTIALGVDARPGAGETDQTAVTDIEAQIGHKVAFTRDFLYWNDAFPTSYEQWLGARGTVPMVSVKSRLTNGTAVPWASVAAAAPGSTLYSQIKSWADRMRNFGYPVYFTYNHEPEAATNNDLGTPASFIAAWRKVHDVFVAEGATNVRFMWIMTAYAFTVPSTDRRYGWDWYPGDAYVDGIASDAYNEANCRYPNNSWKSLATVTTGFMKFGSQHPTIPLWLTEFGTIESTTVPGAKAQWLLDAEALFKKPAYSQVVGISYFNQTRLGTACDWHIDTSDSALAAFQTLAQDPFYQGSVSISPPPPVASFSVTCTGLSCTVDGSTSTGSSALTYGWTFGDGATATGATASHAYASGGIFPITLTVTDTSGASSSASRQVTVTDPNSVPIAFIGSASTTANSSTETVRVPAGVTAGNGLVLIATSATVAPLTAPSGWALVGTRSSATMTSSIWQRVATAADAGSAVAVGFGGTNKGSVELLAYSGTNASGPIASAVGATSDATSATVVAPATVAPSAGQWLLSYWSARSSVETTVTPTPGLIVRSSESGTGGGRITSASADLAPAVAGGQQATVSPAAGHSLTWSVLLAGV